MSDGRGNCRTLQAALGPPPLNHPGTHPHGVPPARVPSSRPGRETLLGGLGFCTLITRGRPCPLALRYRKPFAPVRSVRGGRIREPLPPVAAAPSARGRRLPSTARSVTVGSPGARMAEGRPTGKHGDVTSALHQATSYQDLLEDLYINDVWVQLPGRRRVIELEAEHISVSRLVARSKQRSFIHFFTFRRIDAGKSYIRKQHIPIYHGNGVARGVR